jgi:uncharacterized protein (DUF58 family)
MIVRRIRTAVAAASGTYLGHLTTRGRAMLAAGVTAIICSILTSQRDLLRVAVLLTTMTLVTAVSLSRSTYRLSCARTLTPARAQVGETITVTLRIANDAPNRCGTLLAEESLSYLLGGNPRFVVPGLESGERRSITYPILAHTRGRYRVGPLTLTVTDAFGLGNHGRAFTAVEQLTVLPQVVPRRLAGSERYSLPHRSGRPRGFLDPGVSLGR